MKVGSNAAHRGSFGIPPEISPEALAHRREQTTSSPPNEEPVDEDLDDEEKEQDEAEAEGSPEKGDDRPLDILAKMGIKISTDDWSALFYKGVLEKDIVVAEIPQPNKELQPFTITVKTLTGDEHDEIDEVFAAELQTKQMTREGANTRNQMWNFAYAVQKINGRPVCKPVKTSDGKIDHKATAEEKRKVLSNMSPMVLSMALEKYWTFINQIRRLLENPSKHFFGEP